MLNQTTSHLGVFSLLIIQALALPGTENVPPSLEDSKLPPVPGLALSSTPSIILGSTSNAAQNAPTTQVSERGLKAREDVLWMLKRDSVDLNNLEVVVTTLFIYAIDAGMQAANIESMVRRGEISRIRADEQQLRLVELKSAINDLMTEKIPAMRDFEVALKDPVLPEAAGAALQRVSKFMDPKTAELESYHLQLMNVMNALPPHHQVPAGEELMLVAGQHNREISAAITLALLEVVQSMAALETADEHGQLVSQGAALRLAQRRLEGLPVPVNPRSLFKPENLNWKRPAAQSAKADQSPKQR